MSGIGEALRTAREQRGISIEKLAKRTRITVAHIQAIEEDRHDDLPPGPYREAFVRTLCEALEVEEPEVELPVFPKPLVPLWGVRAIGLTATFTLLALIAWVQWGPEPTRVEQVVMERVKDQVLELHANTSATLEVWVDDEPAFKGVLPGGEMRLFEAYDRIDVNVGAVENVTLRFNDRRIIPQGRQDVPRRLTFIDDGGR